MATTELTAPRSVKPGAVLLELGFVAIAVVLNVLVRWYTRDDYALAVTNAAEVVGLEQRWGLDWEHALQDLTLTVPGLSGLASWYYVAGYFPVVIGAMLWLFVRHPERYRVLRNALLASGALGLLGYAFYPTAPPRLTDFGFADPVAAAALGDAARPAGLANEIAAIPSFHVGWLLLAVVVTSGVVRRRWVRAVLLTQPFVMAFVIVGTGNHWVLDIPPGVLVAGIGLAVAVQLERLRRRRAARRRGAACCAPDATA